MSRELPLNAVHAAAGATFEERAGFRIPRHHGDPAAEVAALRSGAGLLDLSDRGRIRVTGSERATFLQGQLSNDVLKTGAGHGCHATLLTRTGKLVSDLHLWCGEDTHWLDTEPERTEITLATLDRFLISEDAALEDCSAETAHVAIAGPRAAAVADAALAGAASSLEPLAWRALADGTHLARRRAAGEDLFEAWVPVANAAALWHTLHAAGATALGREAWDLATLEAGEARWGVDVDDTHLPLEANLGDAISYTKGCYVGQEVIAKATHLGRISKRLVGIVPSAASVPFDAGATVEIAGETEPVGRVTRSALSPTLARPIALAYLKWKYLEPGTEVLVRDGRGEAVAARVVKLPFLESLR